MTTQKILIKEDSKPYLVDWPEPTEVEPLYYQRIQQAKQSAVPFDKPEYVLTALWEHSTMLFTYDGWIEDKVKSGDTFPIPTGYRVTFRELCQCEQKKLEGKITIACACLGRFKTYAVLSKEESQPTKGEKQKVYLVMTKQLLIVGCFNTEEKANKYANGANVMIQEIEVY